MNWNSLANKWKQLKFGKIERELMRSLKFG